MRRSEREHEARAADGLLLPLVEGMAQHEGHHLQNAKLVFAKQQAMESGTGIQLNCIVSLLAAIVRANAELPTAPQQAVAVANTSLFPVPSVSPEPTGCSFQAHCEPLMRGSCAGSRTRCRTCRPADETRNRAGWPRLKRLPIACSQFTASSRATLHPAKSGLAIQFD